MAESPLGSKPSARDRAEVKAGTATAHDRAEVRRYDDKHPETFKHQRRRGKKRKRR